MLEDQGDFIRAQMKRRKTLKLEVGPSVALAYDEDEKAAMLSEAQRRKGSPSVYPALMLAFHCGLRDKEARTLRWSHTDLVHRLITVRTQTKTEAGNLRTIPMNDAVLSALKQHAHWYLLEFGETRPQWFLFPYGRPRPHDPARHTTTFKTVWTSIRNACGIAGRWHDVHHTFVTDLAEDPHTSDETIRQLAGHVSPQMLKHYSHIRMEAKKRAVAGLERLIKGISEGSVKEPAKVRPPN
jgi:integrase